MKREYVNGFRPIRPGAPNAATELRIEGDRAIQMPGTGEAVEQALRQAVREGRR